MGRQKRFLKIFGNRVNLDEVENMLRAAGFDCACTGIDDNLVIYVTNETDIRSVTCRITKNTSINPVGVNVKYIPRIPRSDSGKILYSQLSGIEGCV